jgi:NhaP-type Na+/H+ or K+/H+ antiporter
MVMIDASGLHFFKFCLVLLPGHIVGCDSTFPSVVLYLLATGFYLFHGPYLGYSLEWFLPRIKNIIELASMKQRACPTSSCGINSICALSFCAGTKVLARGRLAASVDQSKD